MRKFHIIILLFIASQLSLKAQPPGWMYEMPITIYENSGTPLLNHQVPITINTQALIGAGQMDANGDDIRFASSCTGGPLSYWIEDYLNTDTTKIWVAIDSIPANDSVTIMMFYGNPTASPQSTISIFEGPYSGNDSLTGGSPGGSGSRQRGFFFYSSRDILVTQFGKYEPNGTTRYVTLFDSISQGIIDQIQVTGGTPATLSYDPLNKPIWLNNNQTYIITVYLDAGDQYYISSSTQAGPYLTYTRTGWCNTCTQNTFPLNSTTGHYGYPDFEYYVRADASVYPTYQIKLPLTANTGIDDQVCLGDSVQIQVNGTGGSGTYNYQWAPAGFVTNPGIGNPHAFPPATGTFTVTVTDELGCSASDSINITVNPLPSVDLGPDTNLCLGPVLLDAGAGVAGYQWQDMSTNQTFNATIPGVYYVTVIDSVGCQDMDTVEVFICPGAGNIGYEDAPTLNIHPNPTSGNVVIHLEEIHTSLKMVLIDSQGRRVLNKKYLNTNSVTFDLSELPSGIYFVHLTGENFYGTVRLVKQ